MLMHFDCALQVFPPKEAGVNDAEMVASCLEETWSLAGKTRANKIIVEYGTMHYLGKPLANTGLCRDDS